MAKRFTDTEKYKKPFIRGLQGAYKLLWDYLYHDCNHAGIWIVDFDIAQIYVGMDMPINKDDALRFFNQDQERIIEFDGGSKWFIPDFIEFQYGELNPENRTHSSVLKHLKKGNLIKHLISPLQGAMDIDKDKDTDKDKEYSEKLKKFKYLKKMESPLTQEEFKKLTGEYGENAVLDVLAQMDNYKKGSKTVDKCYTSCYLTANNWLKKRKDESSKSGVANAGAYQYV